MNFRQVYNFHPILFGIFPILSLFSFNINELGTKSLFEFYVLIILIGIAALILWKILSSILKNKEKAGLIASFSFVMIFFYGHTKYFFGDLVSNEIYFLTLWLVIFVGGIYGIIKIRREISNIPLILFAISASLLILPLGDIMIYSLNNYSFENTYRLDEIKVFSKPSISYHPDIYYFIFDSYGSSNTLKTFYNYDNIELLDFLKTHEFYVASESTSNYLTTHQSLASSLNMININFLEDLGGTSSRAGLTSNLVKFCNVCKFLKSQGYTYIHFGSGKSPTNSNVNADVNINYFRNRPADFTEMFYETTIISTISHIISSNLDMDTNAQGTESSGTHEMYERILFQFEKIQEIPDMKEPTFVFAHFKTPHVPYVFDEDGTFLSGKERKTLSEKEKYLKQVKAVNKKIEILIDTLLSKSNNPPIIIIQGDHGPPRYKINREERKNGFWKKATIEEIQSRFGILNAYLLPNYDKNSIHPSISPVNSFRNIFNYYFGTDLEILPDNSYSGHNNPINMTDILHGKTSTNVNFEYDIGDKFDWKKIGIENPKNEKFSHIYNLLQVYYQREDLQLAFTKVAEGDLKHLFSWVTIYGVFVYPTLSNYSPIYDLMLVYEESSDLKSEFPEASNAVNLHRLFCWANSHINKEGKNSNPLLIPHESFYNENCLKNI